MPNQLRSIRTYVFISHFIILVTELYFRRMEVLRCIHYTIVSEDYDMGFPLRDNRTAKLGYRVNLNMYHISNMPQNKDFLKISESNS